MLLMKRPKVIGNLNFQLKRELKFYFGLDKFKHVHFSLWSGIVNIEDPEEVTKAHLKFIEAGADIILTNTYKISQVDHRLPDSLI